MACCDAIVLDTGYGHEGSWQSLSPSTTCVLVRLARYTTISRSCNRASTVNLPTLPYHHQQVASTVNPALQEC